jgi:hypothetical protein
MSKIITFGSTVLEGTGKKGILKPMEPGGQYYLLNSGGFNIENRSGIKYRFNDYLRECMREDSDLNRRVREGQLQCELGHPPQYYWERIDGRIVQTPITDVFQWIHRLRTIIEANVCGSVRKIHWVMKGGETDPVYNMIEVRPFGVHGHILKDSLEDPDINTAFSIRTVTKPQKMGDRSREVDYFTGYDLVIEQGMLEACKYRTAGLEDFMSHQLLAAPAEMAVSFDEVVYVCEREMAKESFMVRFEGTESHNQLVGMLDHLKKRYHHAAPVRLKTTSSLNVF